MIKYTLIERLVNKLLPNLQKLNTLAEAIDKIEVTPNGSLYIKYRKHVITESNGHMLDYAKNGNIIHKGDLQLDQPSAKHVIIEFRTLTDRKIESLVNVYTAKALRNLELMHNLNNRLFEHNHKEHITLCQHN